MTRYEDLTYEDKQRALDEAWEEMNPKVETDSERFTQAGELLEVIIEMGDGHGKHREGIEALNWLIQQAERVRELETVISNRYKGYVSLLNENARLRKTLEFYADEGNYTDKVIAEWGPMMEVLRDAGYKATKALEESN